MGRREFIDVEMPDRFRLECLTPDGEWTVWGLYEANTAQRSDDGSYLWEPADGSSRFWLRCMRQDGIVVYVVDGTGAPYTYRLVATESADELQ